MRYLREAVSLGPRNPEALVALAWSQIEVGNNTEAENHLRDCLEVNPDFEEAYVNYGNLMKALGE